MHKLVKFVLLVATSLPLTGCGGCTDSQSAVLRNARPRLPEDLGGPAPASAPAAVQPAVATSSGAAPQRAASSPAGAGKIEAAGPGSAAMTTPQQVKPKEAPVLFAFAPSTLPDESSPVSVVVENVKPAKPPTPREIRTRTIKNLTRIGKAINDYAARYGQYPPRAIRNDSGDFGLSWRVAILPELGYEALYTQFRLYEPWDSPHNKQLLEQIPPEFQSPDRFDTSTNYLAVATAGSVFLRGEPISPAAVTDGLANTIIVVEADDSHAVAWSRPADLVVSFNDPRKGLGALRGDGFLCLLAEGKVLRAPPSMPGICLLSLSTCQGDESISADGTLKAPTLVPPTVATAAAVDAAGGDASAQVTESHANAAPTTPTTLSEVEQTGPPPAPRFAVPDEIALAKARDLFKDLYGDRVAAAAKVEERVKLVREMLADASAMEDNPTDYYELLRIVRDIAAGCGDVNTALQAIQHLEEKFQIDGLAMRLKSLEELGTHGQRPEVAKELPDMAKDVLLMCIDRDDYDAAQTVAEHLLALARAARNGGDVQRASQTLNSLAAARTAFHQVPIALKRLENDSKDAAANETIGKYLCLIKGRWKAGLPYLMKCDDLKLRVIASIDLLPERKPTETTSLGDQYWDMADDFKQPQKRNLKLRAIFWYKVASLQLRDGLERARAQRRIEDTERAYGKFEVGRAITRMISDANLTAAFGAAPRDSSE